MFHVSACVCFFPFSYSLFHFVFLFFFSQSIFILINKIFAHFFLSNTLAFVCVTSKLTNCRREQKTKMKRKNKKETHRSIQAIGTVKYFMRLVHIKYMNVSLSYGDHYRHQRVLYQVLFFAHYIPLYRFSSSLFVIVCVCARAYVFSLFSMLLLLILHHHPSSSSSSFRVACSLSHSSKMLNMR